MKSGRLDFLGVATGPELRLISGGKYTSLKSGASEASPVLLVLPPTNGTANQVLVMGNTGLTFSLPKLGADSTDPTVGFLAEKLDNSTLEVDLSLHQARIKDAGVTNQKLANNSVTASKIASNSVSNGKLATDAVTTTKIANSAVTTSKIADASVTDGKLASAALRSLSSLSPGAGNFIVGNGSGWAVASDVPRVYRRSFTSADLTDGILAIAHNLNRFIVAVTVYNNLNNSIAPDEINLVDSQQCLINLQSFVNTFFGTWNLIVVG